MDLVIPQSLTILSQRKLTQTSTTCKKISRTKFKKHQNKGKLHLKTANQETLQINNTHHIIDPTDTIEKDKAKAEYQIKNVPIKVMQRTMTKDGMKNKEDQDFQPIAVEKIAEAREIHKSKHRQIESGGTQTTLRSQRTHQREERRKKDKKKSTTEPNGVSDI
jgi:hypothetical protein